MGSIQLLELSGYGRSLVIWGVQLCEVSSHGRCPVM